MCLFDGSLESKGKLVVKSMVSIVSAQKRTCLFFPTDARLQTAGTGKEASMIDIYGL
jgi:hypothetical protein